jgi:hypothetical protein
VAAGESASKACVARAASATDDAAGVALWSPAGSAWFGSVAAGESASKACVARAASATGGTVTVTGESLDGAKTASLNVPDASVDRGP